MLNEKCLKHQTKKNKMKQPNAKLHQRISFIKSAIRIIGYVLIPINIVNAAFVLILSELIGIIEELV